LDSLHLALDSLLLAVLDNLHLALASPQQALDNQQQVVLASHHQAPVSVRHSANPQRVQAL
jgi:hypothetical protein